MRAELRLAAWHVRLHRRDNEDPAVIARLLYQSWYARMIGPVATPADFPTDLIQVCRAADATAENWSDGWVAEQVARDGRVVARRADELRLAAQCDYLPVSRMGLLPSVGDALKLSGRRDRVDPDAAWWRTAGRAWRFTSADQGLVRLYWNFSLAHLPTLVHSVTSLLADHDRPWMLKVAGQREAHARADATVLFLTPRAVASFAGAVETIARSLQPHARLGKPPLSLRVLPGLAAAFDPGGDESFGSQRCRLIVEALHGVDVTHHNATTLIEHHLREAGIDCHRPHALRTDSLLPWEQ